MRIKARSRRLWRRGAAIAAGYALDRIFADPTNHHPVAIYGQAVSKLERRIYADSKARGVAFTTIAVAAPVVLTAAVSTVAPTLALTATTWASLGGTTLRRTGERMADRLSAGDIDAARELVPWLCSRDPEALDADGIARATVESLAENTSDAVTGTLMWGAIAGAPGVVAHRAVNTLDAMVGYRNDRYRQFGWASARLDDVAGFLPARLTAVATVVAGPNRRQALAAWQRDASNHPSPNAGVVEASAAGALGLQLGGKTVYLSGVEMRPVLGGGRAPAVADVRRAAELSKRVQNIVALSCAGAVVVAGCVRHAKARAAS
ncbi:MULTISPECIES: cobalamin biosynthesis protein [Corynebacterium]|uniref:cobalamin biosynthesis protein n=1 Tax=Corynebacterium TaxID=1716 RepID=UPI001CA31FBC|nr:MULTISPECIES: cobalamin biosynthesis protein [Corynebacterium]MCA0442950.1 cobalamin biosynthesis protein [Corynebacterium amycolatum]MCG7268547.1 cobalamin biosynthesis protein [Corynebacterium amycolatum]MDK6476510.1 cobalamin biosynthesis protein [Corynebacterium amycolatum]MDK7198937.1 cobalamin biosynthesis protein [Corynebacterium amycolatum]MDK7314712.1 cobalamin biosynthesis protein [Corynebacterium amycolatum]